MHENLLQVGLSLIVIQFEARLADFVMNREVSSTTLGLSDGTISLFTSPVVSARGIVKAPLDRINGINLGEEHIAGNVIIQ